MFGGAAATLALSACASPASEATIKPIGLQLYTLGNEVRPDVAGALRRVAAIGYREVEVGDFYGLSGAELRALLDANGLTCPSLHVPITPLGGPLSFADTPRVVAEAHAIGARYVGPSIFPFPANFERVAGEGPQQMLGRMAHGMGADGWARISDTLNEIGARLRPEGLKLSYHNHNLEFVRVGESTAIDLLLAQTDPNLVTFQIDVGWVAAAGMTPADFIAQHGPRISMLHVKDLLDGPANNALEMQPADVGAGRQDWPAILRAAKAAGVAHYFIEQEPPFTHPRFEAAQNGYNFIERQFRELGIRA